MRRRSPAATPNRTTAVDTGSLGRGLDILRGLGAHGPVVTAAELAAQPGNSRATAERLLHTLASEGFLSLIPGREEEGAYEPGLVCLTLGTALLGSFSELWQRQPVLQDIARRFSVELLVATCDGAQTLIIEHSPATAQQASLVGSVTPIESSAWGRCLAWSHPPTEQALLIDGIRRAQGSRAAASLGALYQAFQGLEENGRCISDLDERSVAIGVPVTVHAGAPLLAIGCVAPRALLADAVKAEVFWGQIGSLSRLIKPPVAGEGK
jgi:DNA-binding IclR family transcriptional regulator